MSKTRTLPRRSTLFAVLVLAACATSASAGDRRDVVFACPCSAQWVPGEPGQRGTVTVTGGIRSHRTTESGELRLSRRWWTGTDAAVVGRVGGSDRVEGRWAISWRETAPGDVVQVHLLEELGQDPEENAQWHRHEALTLWAVPQDDDGTGRIDFVDLLADADGDGFGDVNERLAGSAWDDPDSVPGLSVVDVLALYTVAFREAEESYPYTRLLHALEVSSVLLEDSRTNIRLRIVGMSEVELAEAGWANAEARAELMDSHGADVSVQFSPKGPCAAGGCAQVGARYGGPWSDAQVWDAGGSVWVTVHELGHAMGLAHSYRQGETYGAWRWSRGHYVSARNEGSRWGTIMAYGSRVFGGVFSDPLAACGAGPCGVDGDEIDGADSVSTLDLLRFQIAAHRPPAADSDGDGFVDAGDAAPEDPADWFDVDGDGIADNADPDDDNDGVDDTEDAFPLDPAEWADADLDGIGDNADEDVQNLSPFRDPALRAAVERTLGKTAGAPISETEMASLTTLSGRNVRFLDGLELAVGLEELNLPDGGVADLVPLSGLALLRRLDLGGNAIVDLSPLSALDQLERLDLSDNPVADISALSDLDRIRRLRVDRTGVSYADVQGLSCFGELERLGLGGLGIRDVSALGDLPLGLLNLDDNPLSDLSPLSRLTGLWNLSLADAGLTDIGALADLGLTSLQLRGNDIADVSPLAGMTRLRWLVLADNAVEDIGPLSGLVDLGTLDASGNRIEDVSALSGMVRMRWLSLHDNAVEEIEALTGLVDLGTLNASGNRIKDASALADMVELTWLSLRDNVIEDIGALAGMVDLRTLDASGNRIADVSALSAMEELTWLSLRGNRVEDIGALAELVDLGTLNAGGNRIADLSPLSNMTALRWLSLRANAIADISPLADRAIFGGAASTGAWVNLDGNPLDDASVDEHIPQLRSWGVNVRFTRRGSSVAPTPIGDPTLQALVGEALAYADLHVDDALSDWPIDQLKELRIHGAGVGDLAGLDAAQGLVRLFAASNRIADLSQLAGLAALSELDLRENRIVDIAPLVSNADLSDGDWVALGGNPLSEKSLNEHVPALRDRGVQVEVGSVLLAARRGAEVRFDVSGYFESALGSGSTLEATADDDSAASAQMDDGVLVVTPGGEAGGHTATVTVTGRLGAERLELRFLVTWRANRIVALFPGGSDVREGFARVVNRDGAPAQAEIVVVADSGERSAPLTLTIGAGEAVHFNTADLENGNPAKGLTGSAGPADGDRYLEIGSAADLEVLPFVRTADGFLTAMHEAGAVSEGVHRVPIFNPASNRNQVSSLRLLNLSGDVATATITGTDDDGRSPGGDVRVDVPAGRAVTLDAPQLESGGEGLDGALGDGEGKWRLEVTSAGDLVAMSLLASPEGHVTNLSTDPIEARSDGLHVVPLFLSAAGAPERQGFVRVINTSPSAGVVRIRPYDDAGRAYETLELPLGAGEAAHFNSDDVEFGNASKGITGSAGTGDGDWRLELSSELAIEVFAYVRADGGFLTAIHGSVSRDGRRYHVATFNPASNANQRSKLRIVNPGTRPAHVSIAGVDDAGASPGGVVRLSIPPGTTQTVTAVQLEGGHADLRGMIGDGKGKWRLVVDSEQPVIVMNLLESATGHLTNLP